MTQSHDTLARLERTIADRRSAAPEHSYVAQLNARGVPVIARKLGELPIVACAHQSYLGARGTPQTPDDLLDHDLIGLDRSDLIITAARAGIPPN